MDHHCPWTGNCIGLKNYKYFICFMFWTIIACFFVFLSTPLITNKITFNLDIDIEFVNAHPYLNPFSAWMFSFTTPIAVSVLLCIHLGYLDRNETTLEADKLSQMINPHINVLAFVIHC